MKIRIEFIDTKKLIGKNMKMSIANDKTSEVWRSFMPGRKLIKNRVDNMLYSMQVYAEKFDYSKIDLEATFIKWAVTEVEDFAEAPDGMEEYTLTGGLYAVFTHVGPASEFLKSFKYIFEKWLPNSEYVIDDREHFEKFSEHYNPTDPNATEEIWIPIKLNHQ